MHKNCVILAGGKSSRMKSDKTILKFGNFPTITHFLHLKMSKIFENVFVSCKNDKFDGEFEILKDDFEIFSPLFAIGQSLKKIGEKTFIIAADIPFARNETIDLLDSFNGDIIAPKTEKIHWLCAFYDAKISEILINLAKNGEHKIGNLQNFLDCKIVNFKSDEFENLNTQEDYKKALKWKI